MEIDSHICAAMSGLMADARTLIEHARVETQNYHFTYDEPMSTKGCTQAVCDLALRFGEGGKGALSRPFGVALLIGGCDESGPQLYHADPSGTFVQYEAMAIGAGSEGAQSALEEKYFKSMTLAEAEALAVDVLKQVMEEKVNSTNVEIASVTPGTGYRLYSADEVQTIIDRMGAAAATTA